MIGYLKTGGFFMIASQGQQNQRDERPDLQIPQNRCRLR